MLDKVVQNKRHLAKEQQSLEVKTFLLLNILLMK